MPKKPAKPLVDEMLSPAEIAELRRAQQEQSEHGMKAFAHHRAAKLRPDAAEIAFRVMQEATGEAPKTLPPKERTVKNADAVKRGAQGGKKGGRARALSLTKAQRSKIARKGADSLWKKRDDPD